MCMHTRTKSVANLLTHGLNSYPMDLQFMLSYLNKTTKVRIQYVITLKLHTEFLIKLKMVITYGNFSISASHSMDVTKFRFELLYLFTRKESYVECNSVKY